MSAMVEPAGIEPAISIGAISAAVSAILALLVAFGLDLTEVQTGAILAVVAAVGPIVGAVVTRGKVSPAPKADRDPNVRA